MPPSNDLFSRIPEFHITRCNCHKMHRQKKCPVLVPVVPYQYRTVPYNQFRDLFGWSSFGISLYVNVSLWIVIIRQLPKT